MAIFPGSAIPSAVSDYEIDNSLRLDDGDSAYLSRTMSTPTNNKKWTLSTWFKRGNFPQGQLLSAGGNQVFILAAGQFSFAGGASGTTERMKTTQLFRDPSAWYHIVFSMDTTQSAFSDQMKLYVNGTQVTAFDTSTAITQNDNTQINSAIAHRVGGYSGGGEHWDGYLAEYYFVDGSVLDADDFGELDSTTNQWIPKDAVDDLTFGTNGFYQKYDDPIVRKSFTTVGSTTWTAPAGVTSVDYLVVGGGGAGGTGYGPSGGGGAGGYRTATSYTVVPGTSYDVVVGAGGASVDGSSVTPGVGANGGDSRFATIYSSGGGGGGGSADNAADGGSGGGGYFANGAGGAGNDGSYSPVEGYAGGLGGDNTKSSWAGAGGGGASEVGEAAMRTVSNNDGGDGGDGIANSITGSSVTYAGGGGGATDESGTEGQGGSGGGGNGCHKSGGGGYTPVQATSGTANTGGGGGGAGWNNTSQNGTSGAGGSGIVVLKYGTGFGKDSSGEDNNFTATNLVATDQMIDTPTNNFATFNPLSIRGTVTLSEGNLKATPATSGLNDVASTMAMSTGKWYAEFYLNTLGSSQQFWVGITESSFLAGNTMETAGISSVYKLMAYALKRVNNTNSSYGSALVAGDILGIAYNGDDNEVTFYKNNATMGAISCDADEYVFTVGRGDGSPVGTYNFGQDSSFAGAVTAQGNQDGNSKGDFYYEPPSGFLALCTSNLPDPEIALPGENFNTVLYAGNDSTSSRAITTEFQPDFVWLKNRSDGYNHVLQDSVRGFTTGKKLSSNLNVAESTGGAADTYGYIGAVGSTSLTLNTTSGVGQTNVSGNNYVGWYWKVGGAPTADNSAGAGATPTAGSVKIDGSNLGSALAGSIAATRLSANTTSGFSIVGYTGTGSNATVGHGLSQAPEMVIVKNIDSTEEWPVGSDEINGGSWAKYLGLSDTSGESGGASRFNSTAPTSSVVNIGTSSATNSNTEDFIMYCFHSVEGYSKIFSFTGNDDVDGPFLYTGFKPAMVIGKCIGASGGWAMIDSARNTYNVAGDSLYPNTDAAADTSTTVGLDFLSNGIKVRSTSGSWNQSDTMLAIAFAESPFKTSNAR